MDEAQCCSDEKTEGQQHSPPGKEELPGTVPGTFTKKKKVYEKLGSAGLPGVSFQIDLIVLFLLKAISQYTADNWSLSTENKAGDKFDDVVFESSTGDVLLQAKHKQNAAKKITVTDLLSTNSKKCDFSLPMYFFSYQEVKKKFNVKYVILCTNAGMQMDKNTKNAIKKHDLGAGSMLYFAGHGNSATCYTFTEDFIPKLKENIEVYCKENLQRKNVSYEISNEDVADYLNHLQVITNYPSDENLEKGIQALISELDCSQNLSSEVCAKYIRQKIEEWYKEKGVGRYFTKVNGMALFSDVRSSLYCETLKQHDVCFDHNDSLVTNTDAKKIRHIITQENSLLTVVKVYQELRNKNLTEVLFLDMNLDDAFKNQIVDSFEVAKYTHLVIICSQEKKDNVWEEMSQNLLNTLNNYKYKQVLFIGNEEAPLIEDIKRINTEICGEIKGDVFFLSLAEDTRERIKEKNCIVYQGKEVNLHELCILDEHLDKILSSEMILKLANDEKITVGHQLSSENVDYCYIPRHIEQLENSFLEENFYAEGNLGEERAVVISGIAGMGKSVFLTKLSLSIKENFPHLWVIKLDLNAFKKYLSERQSDLNPVGLLDLLNSMNETKLDGSFELKLFSLDQRVVLLVDGVDEISPKYTDIVCNLLSVCKDKSNIKKIFVTTRPHLHETLESIFKVKSYTFRPFSKPDQKEFLAKYWTKSLNILDSEKTSKCLTYAEELIKNMCLWIDDGQNTFGTVPLQIKMLAEVFQEKIRSRSSQLVDWETCKEFLTLNTVVPKLPEKINLTELYGEFITKKCDVLVHEKEHIRGNDLAEAGLRKLFEDYHEYHCKLALEVVLDKSQCEIFHCHNALDEANEGTIENLLKIGIIQRIGGNLQFIHRTFAEYFTARVILAELKRENQDKRFQKCFVEVLLRQEDFYMVRAFLDNFLESELLNLPRNTFETYHFVRINRDRTWRGYEEDTFLHVISGEGCSETLKFFLDCFKFTGFTNPFYYLLSKILPKSVHVNVTGDWGDTPLHRAANNGHLRAVKLLVEDPRIDVSIKDGEGLTPLDHAAENGHLQVVRYLKEIAKVGLYNKTPHRTAKKGHFDVVVYLIEHDAEMKTLPGCQVLHFSAYHGRCDVVQQLLNLGVDVDAKDVSGCTALNYACTARSEEVMKLLLDRGASPCSHAPSIACSVKLYFALPRNIPRSEVRIKEKNVTGNVEETTALRKFFKNYVDY